MPGRKLYLPDADPGFHARQANLSDYMVVNAVARVECDPVETSITP